MPDRTVADPRAMRFSIGAKQLSLTTTRGRSKMPSTRRWSVPPKRIAATAVLGVIGIFVICGSVGLGAWLVAAIGIAVVAIGAGIFVLTALNSRSTSEIEGTAHVSAISAPPSGVTHGRCRLNLVLYSKGINGVGIRIRDDRVPVAKWPDVGADLPVMITIDKPQRTRVLWDEVATHRESAEERARAREADERAAAMAADNNAYADLDAALDNVDVSDLADLGVSDLGETRSTEPMRDEATSYDAPPYESPTYEPEVDEPPSYEPDADEAAVDEPAMATTGTRTIEMDLMDPSLMFWTGPPSPRRPVGSRPSPYRRRRSDPGAAIDPPTDEPPPQIEDARPATDVEPVPSQTEPFDDVAITVDPIEADLITGGPITADLGDLRRAAAPDAIAIDADPIDTEPIDANPIESDRDIASDAANMALLIDNGQIVDFDVFDGGPPSADSDEPPRLAPPEWPPRSAAAAAAAAALPHQWDNDGRDDLADEPGEDHSEVAATDDASTDNVSDPDARRVPRNRAASADEVFDQDTADDGPEYSPGTAYADDAGYDPGAGYSSDADYAEPGRPDAAE
jgi:hypothetical protein